MKSMYLYIFTGREEFNEDIAKRLQKTLEEFNLEVTEDPSLAELVITTPEYCRIFHGVPILVLTDSIDSFLEVENAIEWTPIPITDDDFLRLEFRLIGVTDTIRYGHDV